MEQELGATKVRFNFGCGTQEILEGYRNFDFNNVNNDPRVDFIDLEKPLPFEDNSVDEIRIWGTLEHINNWIQLMQEMYRILKTDGIVDIRVPNYACRDAYTDPSHVNFFNCEVWHYFNKDYPAWSGKNAGNTSGYYEGYGCNFKIQSLKRASKKFNIFRKFRIPAEAIEWLSGDLIVKLRAAK